MGQKVWVIDDRYWKESPGKSRMDDPPPAKKKLDNRPLPGPPQKNPALSFSLSMLVWGGGHMYIGEYGPGSIFLAAMIFFYSAISALMYFRYTLSRFVAEIGIPVSALVSGAVVFFFAGLLFWLVNAVDAYYRTARLRSEPFWGVDNDLWPLLCSLLFPGWGQFLNGQPKKGIFFLLFGMTGIFSAIICTVAQHVWPVLKASPARFVSEICFAGVFSLIPISFLMWIVSAYDSFGSCRQLIRKKPGSQQAGYRMQGRGSVRGLIPRGTMVLGLLLAISVGMQFIPKKYYRDSLEEIRIEMLRNDMELVPELVRKISDFIDS